MRAAISGRFVFSLLLGIMCFGVPASAQQPDSSTTIISDAPVSNDQPSVAELARKARKDHTRDVQMTQEDAKKLFESVDKIFDFAADDTGFAKHTAVKRRLISEADVEQHTRDQEKKREIAQRIETGEMTMKKFGFLPRDFNLQDFMVKATGKELAAYYDPETKTISLLNWIPLDKQAPILAHELTHALQDQNYGLKAFLKTPNPADPAKDQREDDIPTAHRAVVEGQAQVVLIDYVLQPAGRSLLTTPGLIYQMEDPMVRATADSELMHSAPMIMREMGTFPYRDGLIFEGELLQNGGKGAAFAGAFARPPRTTHEILQPKSYIDHEKQPIVHLPDMLPLLDGKYSVYDSGSIGELDIRALLEQYGERRVANDLASSWMGSRYITFRKADGDTTAKPATADLALLYVSKWKTEQAAQRFAKIYATAVSQRYQNATPQEASACADKACPASSVQFATEEGPVIVEQWPDNSVVVSESFDQMTAAKLVNAARNPRGEERADNLSQDELGLRLYDCPGFSMFQAQIQASILEQIAAGLGQ